MKHITIDETYYHRWNILPKIKHITIDETYYHRWNILPKIKHITIDEAYYPRKSIHITLKILRIIYYIDWKFVFLHRNGKFKGGTMHIPFISVQQFYILMQYIMQTYNFQCFMSCAYSLEFVSPLFINLA